jgi:hypothetical protein
LAICDCSPKAGRNHQCHLGDAVSLSLLLPSPPMGRQ